MTITGTDFSGATAVTFGSTAAASFTVNSATSITAVSPAGTGTVNITVTSPDGTSPVVVADQFTYQNAVPDGEQRLAVERPGGWWILGDHHRHRLHRSDGSEVRGHRPRRATP